jgi:hypothetical protein
MYLKVAAPEHPGPSSPRVRRFGLDHLRGMLPLAAEDAVHALLVVDRVLAGTAEDGISARHTRYEIIPSSPMEGVIAAISGHLVAARTTEHDIVAGAQALQAVIAAHSVATRTAIKNIAAVGTVHQVSSAPAEELVPAVRAKQEIGTVRAELHRNEKNTSKCAAALPNTAAHQNSPANPPAIICQLPEQEGVIPADRFIQRSS